jgi:Fe-Mn family superoxide dismutase
MRHELPPLPYAKDALQPYMSAETLEYHHGKHHKAYVDTLNKLIEGTEYQDMALEDIIRKSEGKIFNNAAQVWNHTFFWNCMGPGCGGEPSGELAQALVKSFKHFGEFKRQFSEAAINQFGTGWAWLVQKADGSLAARASEDADNPLTTDETPLLTLDVWEHAYYIDYRNERPKFVEAFWSVVNWDFVNANFVGKRQR